MSEITSLEDQIKVLYIAGFERSGSTIINRVLGQIDEFVAWGELRDIWEHGDLENRTCTCGKTFHDCSAWGRIFDGEFRESLGLGTAEMLSLKRRTKAAVLLKSFGPLGRVALNSIAKDYMSGLSALYQTIQSKTGSRVIVDSTKASWYGYVLSRLPNIDLYTVHVVRDPRGVCYSLQQRKAKGDTTCDWYNPLHASLSWVLKNSGIEQLLETSPQRYLRIKYEDFMAFPEETVALLLSFINEPAAENLFVRKSTVKMGMDHIISGSPSSRSDVGEVELKTDSRWHNGISSKDRALVERFTKPLLKKYGYGAEISVTASG